MKPRTLLTISLAVLAGWLIIVLYVSGDAIQAMSTALGSVEPESYLPLVYKQMTPTPTPTPTPTVTPTLPPVYVMDNHSSYANRIGGYTVVGEVRNNTGGNVWNIRVGADFYKYGQIQPTDSISATLSFIFRLSPGDKTCFALDRGNRAIDWDYYVFDSVTTNTPDLIPPPLINIEGDVTALAKPGEYQLSGFVKNDHSDMVYGPRVQGTLYDENWIVLDCRWEYTLNPTLLADQTSFFDLDFGLRTDGYGAVRRYRLETQADYP